ncbi:MAG TPA: FtsX-like permease family protein, partial [Burkholderiales bacterium]|nr:FtsX-like permease family protein [Burkholderiales bacterium]
TIGFFADRVHLALARQANLLLGADLVVVADRPLPPAFEAEAQRRGLAAVRMLRFPSMAMRGDANLLSSVKVVTPGYPLRGEVRIAERLFGPERRASGIPAPGTVWVDERLYSQLGLAIGERVSLGRSQFTVAAILTYEPDTSIGFLSAAPRVHLNEVDIAATGLIQPGSRIRYRLLIAGEDRAVERYRNWIEPRLESGQRVEGIRDARPEVRSALERAERFLNLAALLTVVIAAVAIALAARRFLQRHLDACAMMRCLGARQMTIVRLYVLHFTLLGVCASALGCALGLLAQLLLSHWLSTVVSVPLPTPGALPAAQGVATGIVLLLGFALPPLAALAQVPTLRVIRRELGAPRAGGWVGYGCAILAIAALILWRARDLTLALIVLGGFAATVLTAALVTGALILALARWRSGGVAWRFGIANLRRHAFTSTAQVIALGTGLMALLTLTIVRGDLLSAWETTLPPAAPNRFIVNIQPAQLDPLAAFFTAHGVAAPRFLPMVRGRLIAINGRSVSAADYEEERARRLINREFNLSWAATLQSDNQIVSGKWWGLAPVTVGQFSMESGIAEALGVRLGDTLTFSVAGQAVRAAVTSLRKVDWDTFNVNFFVLAPPGLLDRHPATYVTSFYLPLERIEVLNALVQAFPNLLVIDVARILGEVQRMMDQVARAVQFVFLFTLLAGLLVLYAAIAGTRDERLYQASVLRALGASRAQVRHAQLAEFGALGALAGLLAGAGANALGMLLAMKVLHLDYGFKGEVWVIGILCGAIGIAIAGYLGTRTVLRVAPLRVLQRLG